MSVKKNWCPDRYPIHIYGQGTRLVLSLNNIDWNFRLPSLGFKCILVGLMNMIDGMQFWTPIFFTDIKQFLLAHGYVALTNDILKVYKVVQV
jgi:hypothetical protein